MRKFFSGLLFFGFILLCVAFLVAMLSTFISPKYVWFLSFFGLAFPSILLGILFYFFLYLFTKSKRVVYPLLMLVLLGLAVPNYFNLFFKFKDKKQPGDIKVMTYNVRNFDAYNKDNGEAERDKILALIDQEQPDILCLQEAYNKSDFINLRKELKKLNLPYLHFEIGTTGKTHAEFGVAVASKYPIESIESYPFGSGGNVGAQVVLKIDSTLVSVYNIHLESANIDNKYYNYTAEELAELSKKSLLYRARRVKYQLKQAFIKRADQANLIHQHIKDTENPIIVCGDFNDTPISYSYSKVKGGLADSFKKGHFGLGATYAPLPFLRIDQIFSSKELEATSHHIIKQEISDHYPVVATFQWKQD